MKLTAVLLAAVMSFGSMPYFSNTADITAEDETTIPADITENGDIPEIPEIPETPQPLSAAIFGAVYTYEINTDDSITILSVVMPQSAAELNIPAVIGGHPVSALAKKALVGSMGLRRVTIPGSVRVIGEKAFMSCTQLSEVVLEDGTEIISDDAFFSCPKLVSINFPDTLEYIGSEAFFGCTEIRPVIPANVSYIGSDAFGVTANYHTQGTSNVHNFFVKGYSKSSAEEYCLSKGIDFVALDNYLSGDVNGDGTVDASDASLVLVEYSKISTGSSTTFSDKQHFLGDMNNDDSIDSSDASVILQIYAKNSTSHGPSETTTEPAVTTTQTTVQTTASETTSATSAVTSAVTSAAAAVTTTAAVQTASAAKTTAVTTVSVPAQTAVITSSISADMK